MRPPEGNPCDRASTLAHALKQRRLVASRARRGRLSAGLLVTLQASRGARPPPARARSGRPPTAPAIRPTRTPRRSRSGVKFRSDVAGFDHRHPVLQGRRQHRHPRRHLWTSTGTLLATATFTGETATGWQQVIFATPVAIAAEHHLRRLVLRARRPLRRRRRLLRRPRRRQRPAARAGQRHRRRQRRLPVRRRRRRSRPAPSSRPTTGSTSSSPPGRRTPRRRR